MPTVDPVLDTLRRPLKALRVSVTDRCNLRCRYCMPEEEYVWLPKASILSFEEVDRLVGVLSRLGVEKVRLTGGEPLLRQDLSHLVGLLSEQEAVTDLALTTNGVLLARQADALAAAGLRRVTVSLDTIRPDRYAAFNRAAKFAAVVEGIAAARRAGLETLKINSVVIRGFNDDELIDLLEFAGEHAAELRFIEYMDVGGATEWSLRQVVSRDEMLATIAARYGEVTPVEDRSTPSTPARRYRLPDGRTFGVVASTTGPFCAACDRARLTADGMFYTCLYADLGLDLRELVRSKISDDGIMAAVTERWRGRTDRAAEERADMRVRDALYQIDGLRADPHREMHTRGG
jgi:cyclic pyranopterin phosphate synthase